MSHRLLFFAASLGLALLAPGASRAEECSSGCGAQLKACVRTARADAFACKLDCLANPPAEGRRACVQACADAVRAIRTSCKTQVEGCVDTCAPALLTPDQRSCLAPCGTALGECARAAIADARECLAPCRDAADRVACWRDCVATAQTGATACAGDLGACATSCGVTPPPLPTPPPADACGAQCRTDLTQCLADVAQTAFACGSTCFSGASPLQCLQACTAPAEAGAAACRDAYDGCSASCAP